MNNLTEVITEFCIEGQVRSITETGNGHINDTYLVCTDCGNYILQRINTVVFRDPEALMENVVAVTEHIGGELMYIPTRNGGYYYMDSGNCWRMMTCIENSYSCESSDDPEIFYEIGKAYGTFISDLADFPAESLHETIAGFHDTRKRYSALLRAVERDETRRKNNALDEIRFAVKHEKDVDILSEMAANGELPLRVTHNDTKINNVLLDVDTNRGVCVIDLDTVMPGLAVNDFGDAVRSGACTGREDEKDISRIGLDLDIYRSLAQGFCEGFPDMTPTEHRMMPYGAKIMTLECGIRFLTDYLEGDKYFKTDYPDHNLVRCRTQFRLVQDMEAKWKEMQDV